MKKLILVKFMNIWTAEELKNSINNIEMGEIRDVAEHLDDGGINLSEVDDFLDNYLEELNRLIEHMEIRNMD